MSHPQLAPTHHLLDASTVEAYREAMGRATALVADRVATVDRPYSGATLESLQAQVSRIDLDRPAAGLAEAMEETAGLYVDHAIWFHEPRYMAHLNCPVAVPALAADALASAVNTSVDTWDQSTSATLIERRLVEWTCGRIGFGAASDGVFTSGGTQSNTQALLLAREDCRHRHGDPRDADGHDHAGGLELGRLRVLATAQSHFSVTKGARLLGLAPDAVRTVATDAAGRMSPSALAVEIEAVRDAGDVVMAVVATAGTTDRGAIDPLAELADVTSAAGVWLHVDAAYGCGLLVSPTRRHWLDGIERADSVTVDFHKSFFQPVASSAVLVRDGHDLRHVTHHADYLNPRRALVPNQVDKSLQTTRRFDALKLWMTLRVMGADEIGRHVDTVVDLAADAATTVSADPDLELCCDPQLSTVLFRFRPEGVDEDEADRVNPLVRSALFASGRAVVAGTRVDGRHWLKLTLLNPSATTAHVREVLDLLVGLGHDLLAGPEDRTASSGPRRAVPAAEQELELVGEAG
ncbi:pyridoxal phosphate-dependent decarboxylase family protein [Auraticoccus monumenti]|uniref:L-2,4-diaminobutyrate decarboxylase n=1 Tax=Auraticoccus monumenti TaxID=675864 RepID=A0A1G6X8E7_9ACTN|nr:aspartate aminotransferase family protein [Auraticoccus monumenti]SDD74408.1 L-2,4-diaminobutyrate decarboxylase [Auraticoccus monumenti]